jgi:hypothetical protein
MKLEIRGHHLPGRSWNGDGVGRENVHVGVQVRRDPTDLVPGDASTATWTVPITLTAADGGWDFRGPAVQGRPGERFVYLTWGDLGGEGTFAMFRRAKLMLADLAPLLRDGDADADPCIRVDVGLTDERGGPRCARLRPPALQVSRA